MLEQINSARNMGNANAALARANFQCADQISTEFLLCLMRLSGEDFNGALVDFIFNEDAAVAFINHLINEANSEFDDPSPERLARGFQTILDLVLVPRVPQPPTIGDSNHDDIYADGPDDEVNDDDHESNSAHSSVQHAVENLFDDEAEEVPEGEESEPAVDDDEDAEGELVADDDDGTEGPLADGKQADNDIPLA